MGKHKDPKVVVIGGGTGMPVLLRGLKNLPIDLTALVNVADDGGRTGRIRNDMAMPAPGDIRNVIDPLSEAEPRLLELFQHRFEVGDGISGPSMGNLLLAAMTSVTGGSNTGIREISSVLKGKGEIYRSSNDSMSLHARMTDCTTVSGESKIPLVHKQNKRVFLSLLPLLPLPKALAAIERSDLV